MEKKDYFLDPIPEGYQIFERRLEVAGIQHRKEAAQRFAGGDAQRLQLKPEPSNEYDPNAIRVIGVWKDSSGQESTTHIGYLDKNLARVLTRSGYVQRVLPRLESIFQGGHDNHWIGIDFQLLGPKGELQKYESYSEALGGASVSEGAGGWPEPKRASPLSDGVASPNYAGFWIRFLALLIDSLVTGLGTAVILLVWWVVVGEYQEDDIPLTLELFYTIAAFAYFVFMESSAKQATLGKMALGLKVTDLNGKRIGLGKACLRQFGHVISVLTLGIGFLMVVFTKRKQTLHDKIAGTLIVRK